MCQVFAQRVTYVYMKNLQFNSLVWGSQLKASGQKGNKTLFQISGKMGSLNNCTVYFKYANIISILLQAGARGRIQPGEERTFCLSYLSYRRFTCLLRMSDYPCRVCKEEVGVDDKGIQCEGECQYWYHCACLGISDGEYDCLAASDSKWKCSKCSSADLPVLNSVDAVDGFHFDFQKNLPTPKR